MILYILLEIKKYMRIQGEELAYKTKKTVDVFVLTSDNPGKIIYEHDYQISVIDYDK